MNHKRDKGVFARFKRAVSLSLSLSLSRSRIALAFAPLTIFCLAFLGVLAWGSFTLHAPTPNADAAADGPLDLSPPPPGITATLSGSSLISGTVTLPTISPISTGASVETSITSTVSTEANGYTTSFKSKDANTCLVHSTALSTPNLSTSGCSSVATNKKLVSVASSTPHSSLPSNQWGIAVGAGNWLPALTTDTNLVSTTTPATNAATTISIGARADTTLNAGAYSGALTITTSAKLPPPPTITGLLPASGSMASNEIRIFGTNLENIYEVFIDLNRNGLQDDGEACTDTMLWGYDGTQFSCALPAAAVPGTYDVVVKTWGGATKSATDPPTNTSTITDDYTYHQDPPAVDLSQACSTGYSAAGQTLPQANEGIVITKDPNLIPVKYTGTDTASQWQTADVNNTGNDWYNYDTVEKKWANAVTIKPSAIESYRNTSNKIVVEADVLGYWVYIPRYRYQVQHCAYTDTAPVIQVFNIKFEDRYGGSYQKAIPATDGDWATHPAFTFGTTELDGIWVGKFETSSPDDTGSTTAANNQVTNNNVFIKPNQYSMNFQNLSTQFKVARAMGVVPANEQQNLKMNGSSGILNGVGGLTIPQNTQNLTSNTNTRMAKNSDWGAIVYLSASDYGAGVVNNDYGRVQINANITSYGVTGCGPSASGSTTTYSGNNSTCISSSADKSYYTPIGQIASTTNNRYGVYDMSGGSWEHTVANYNRSSGYSCPDNLTNFSGFTGACSNGSPNPVTVANTPSAIAWGSVGFEDKYYDAYVFTAQSSCTFAACGGHALYETRSWNADYARFISAAYQWFERGGRSYNEVSAGLFASDYTNGNPNNDIGFRAVQSAF